MRITILVTIFFGHINNVVLLAETDIVLKYYDHENFVGFCSKSGQSFHLLID